LKRLLAILLVIGGLAPVPRAQSNVAPVDVTFRFSVAGEPVQSGKLWLFFYGWGFLDTYTVGDIRDGLIRVRMTDAIVRDEIKPPDNWDMFAFVVEVPNVGWYRTPDLGDFVGDTVGALDRLGAMQLRDGVHVVDLPAPARQRIRVLNQNGTPRAGLTLTFEMYVTEQNRCARHQGFGDRRQVVTDRNGVAELVAPIYPLFLANDSYEETIDSFRHLQRKDGQRLEAGREHTVRQVWDRAPDRTFRIHIRDANGRPGRGTLSVREGLGCDAGARTLGTTNAGGIVTARFAIEHAEELFLSRDDREAAADDSLTAEEMATLARTGELAIVWPRPTR